jgi:hypothetical protein
MLPANSSSVIAGLDPAIHALASTKKDVDARLKAGHDNGNGGRAHENPRRSGLEGR